MTINHPDGARPESAVQPPYRTLVVEDHAMVRRGLSLLLAEEPDISVVGEAGDGLEGIERARELRPDVVVIDYNMPRMDGPDAVRILRAEFPKLRIIMFSMYGGELRAEKMLEVGADAYVKKNGRIDKLLAAIRGRE